MNNNEPVILGKVKKGGTSKPIVIIILFLFIGGIIFLLPTILNYFGDYSIIELVKNGEIIDFIENHDNYMNGSVSLKNSKIKTTTKESITTNYINNKTVINNNDFSLSDFKLTNENISFKVTVTKTINFDNDYYYLILSKNNNTLSIIKLTGNVTNSNIINYNFKKELDDIIEIEGKIKKYNDNDFPTFTLSSDESGLASLNCKLDSDSYEYLFDNNKLIKIKETYTYKDTGDNNEYLTMFNKYSKIANDIIKTDNESTITEDNNGFIYTANVDLSKYDKKINNN